MSAPTTSDNLTRQDATKVATAVTQALKPGASAMSVLAERGKSIPALKKAHDSLAGDKTKIEERVKGMAEDIGKTSKSDPKFAALVKDAKDWATKAAEMAKKKTTTEYWYGTTKVASYDALLAKIKEPLPTSSEKHASQALSAATAGGSGVKDAGKAGTGVKHSSAGVKDTKDSATVFFTVTQEEDGMKSVFKVVAVGSHADKGGSASYHIYKSFPPVNGKLKEGATFSV